MTLSSFAIGQTEVTQELWQAVMGSNPSNFKGAKLPVECVSWNDCQTFIEKLNQLTGKKFRLPTEAEWEYAARGGKNSKGYKYAGSNTIDDVAWYTNNSGSQTHEVATKSPNELGLYDMSGNVWEWCQDWYGSSYYSNSPQTNPTGPSSGSSRVLRGGSWDLYARYCRVSIRGISSPGNRIYYYGLRLAMDDSQSDVSPGEAIDLGLPSGTLWASCNVGATKPEEYGDYFAWGETKGFNSGKTTFNWDTYFDSDVNKYNNSGGLTELALEDDAAYVNWGSNWRMPSSAQQHELYFDCTWTWTTCNGVKGYQVTGPNGNSIFLPAAGRRSDDYLSNSGSVGYYWSSSLSSYDSYYANYGAYYSGGSSLWDGAGRYVGRSIRPVKK